MNIFHKSLILTILFLFGSSYLYAEAPIAMWSDATHNTITLGWNDSVDETAYKIYATGNPSPLATLAQDTTFYTVTNLAATTTYSYKITAIIDGVEVENEFFSPTIATTTHVWNEGPFRDCINSWIGISSSAIPTRNQLEALDSSRMIYCGGQNISDISPIADLKYIMAISLQNNLLTMESIAPLASLTQLGTIILADNPLSGELPSWLSSFSNLTHLDLSNTSLTDSIPSWIVNLPLIRTLKLYDNNLIGSIPADIGNWISLFALYLHNNSLTGVIPTQISTLMHLEYLHLENNDLTGGIPSEITNDTKLYDLNLSHNNLTGPIPPQLDNLTSLTWLNLGHNQLSGTIPDTIGTIYPNLIDLSNNKLTGAIPSTLSNNYNSLRQLFLDNNYFSGEIPSSFTSFQSISNNGDLTMHSNCDLFTNNQNLKTYLDGLTPTGYQGIVDTNGNCFYLKGDINANGFVTLDDLILVLQIATEKQLSSSININADINGNNMIDLTEALYIINTIGGGL